MPFPEVQTTHTVPSERNVRGVLARTRRVSCYRQSFTGTTYHNIPSIIDILVDMQLLQADSSGAMRSSSRYGEIESIRDTAQRYENESEEGVHIQMNENQSREIEERKRRRVNQKRRGGH